MAARWRKQFGPWDWRSGYRLSSEWPIETDSQRKKSRTLRRGRLAPLPSALWKPSELAAGKAQHYECNEVEESHELQDLVQGADGEAILPCVQEGADETSPLSSPRSAYVSSVASAGHDVGDGVDNATPTVSVRLPHGALTPVQAKTAAEPNEDLRHEMNMHHRAAVRPSASSHLRSLNSPARLGTAPQHTAPIVRREPLETGTTKPRKPRPPTAASATPRTTPRKRTTASSSYRQFVLSINIPEGDAGSAGVVDERVAESEQSQTQQQQATICRDSVIETGVVRGMGTYNRQTHGMMSTLSHWIAGQDNVGTLPQVKSAALGSTRTSPGKQRRAGDVYAYLGPLAKLYNLPIDEVRDLWAFFTAFDPETAEEISLDKFKELIRVRCNLQSADPVPSHLLFINGVDLAYSGCTIRFEDCLQWQIQHAFTEEVALTNPVERQRRRLARELQISVLDVEKVEQVFSAFDVDGSGEIDQDEFKLVVLKLLGAKNETDLSFTRLQRYWREVDTDCSGSVNITEFMIWYSTHYMKTGGKLAAT